MRWSVAYGYTKERSGAMRSGIKTVEECVKNVIGPVYDKFHLVPDEILRHADDFHSFSTATIATTPISPAAVHTTAMDVVKTIYGKYEPAAKELYERYEPAVEQCATSPWRRLNRLSIFSKVADTVVPKAAYCMEKYNEAVVVATEKGYRVSSYLPVVPKEKISRV